MKSFLWPFGLLCLLWPIGSTRVVGQIQTTRQTQIVAGKQPPTIQQSLSMRLVSGPRLSPDGRLVVYQERTSDWERNAFVTQLWIAVTATGKRYQLTNGDKSCHSPDWSPDGRRLAFLSERDGQTQIFLIAPDGGEASRLTGVANGITGFEWSPDGRRIAFTTPDPESETEKEKYGGFEVIPHRPTMTHLWLLDLPTEGLARSIAPERLTGGQGFTVEDFSWSPDSRRIAFSAPKGPDPDSADTARIYALDVSGKSVTMVADTKGPNNSPHWSPDGRKIAYVTANGRADYFFANSCIATVPETGGRPTIFSGVFDENPNLLAWTNDGLYFSASQRTYAHLFRLTPGTGTVKRISTPTEIIGQDFAINRDGTRVAFTLADAKSAFDIAVSPTEGFAPRRLTDMTAPYLKFRIATRQVISWRSSDGTPIEGILVKPADFVRGRRYPLLCVIHGGPTDVDRAYIGNSGAFPVEQLVARGALVLRVNYRGSAGYGEKFRALNVRNLGLGDYEDVISGVNMLVAQGIVDKGKVGAMGWSEGGYICAFMATYSDRFKAVSVGAGIADWTAYYAGTDIHGFTRQYLKATPWDDPAIYRKTSPINYIKKAKTPTLIIHGEHDDRVPVSNAYELYQGLKDRGVSVKMLLYTGAGHGVGNPKGQRTVNEQNYGWFCRWIWGDRAAGE